MLVGKRTRSDIGCVFSQAHGDTIKQKHIRLEVNEWRSQRKQTPLGFSYFGLVMKELQKEGFAEIVRGTAMPYWDDFKVWRKL